MTGSVTCVVSFVNLLREWSILKRQIVSESSALTFWQYSRLSLNGHLYKTDTSVKRTPRVGPCLSLLPFN